MNLALWKKEGITTIKLFIIFICIISLYVGIIVTMYDPELENSLTQFYIAMPELMKAVGMQGGAQDILHFMINYLYGFILLMFPMIFVLVRCYQLISRYFARGSMAVLLSNGVSRKRFILTQWVSLLLIICLLIGYITICQYGFSQYKYPGELPIKKLLFLNFGLFGLHFAIGSLCFLGACIFQDPKKAMAWIGGLPIVMFILTMLEKASDKAFLSYMTIFTLFDPNGLVNKSTQSIIGMGCLWLIGLCLSIIGMIWFCHRDVYL